MNPDTIGERLRRARERSGATLLQASHATKIRPDFLESMERDSFGFVSGKTYVRGLLLSYTRWLRLDADELADIRAAFDRAFGPPAALSLAEMVPEPATRAPRPPRNQWVIAAALAAGVLLVLSLAGIVHTPGSKEVASPPPVPQSPSPKVLAQAPTAAPPGQQGINLTVSAVTDRSWVRVESDGDQVHPFQGIIAAGGSRTFQANNSIKVTIGNIGAVRLNLNGRDLGKPGASGQTVGTFTFTPDSLPFAPG
ncbi:MAG TPA: RodZ domain-containing protein [Actinomycetota bacterium]